jgi:hypothetical protein
LYSSAQAKDILDIFTHEVSKELDIIIYDSTNHSPIYQDGDFIVVKPESVRSVIEVKSILRLSEIKKSVQNYIDFAYEWYRFGKNHQSYWNETLRLPGLFIVNWKLRNKKGNLNHSSKTITQKIIEEYKQAEITGFYYKEKYFPFITACFVYDEFMINDTVILNLDGSVDYGYSISSTAWLKYLN